MTGTALGLVRINLNSLATGWIYQSQGDIKEVPEGAQIVSNKKILVVDDQSITRTGTALLLTFLGFETEEAGNGFTALEKLKDASYAAIIMDYAMPEMNGPECAVKIRELEKTTGRRTPIIGMSASREHQIRENCLKAGMDDFLDKDCTRVELEEVLLKWLTTC